MPKRAKDLAQAERFKKTAPQLGVDESPEAFEQKLRIASVKPAQKPKAKKRA